MRACEGVRGRVRACFTLTPFVSFENLSTDRFLSFLMCFLNLTCPVLVS